MKAPVTVAALLMVFALAWSLVGTAQAQSLPELKPPKTGKRSPKDAAVIIAVERYIHLPRVEFASRDADAFEDLLRDTMGVPSERIARLDDEYVTPSAIKRNLREKASVVAKGGTLWVYFNGHGSPAKGQDAWLMGAGVLPKSQYIEEQSMLRSEMLALAEKSRGARVVVVLDACFSGKDRGGEGLAKLKFSVPSDLAARPNVVVWSATSGGQYAGVFDEVRHGLFTYFAVGALSGWAADEQGRVPLERAQRYVKRAMRDVLDRRGQRRQVPQVTAPREAQRWVLSSAVRDRAPNLSAWSRSRKTAGPEVSRPAKRDTSFADRLAAIKQEEAALAEERARLAQAEAGRERRALAAHRSQVQADWAKAKAYAEKGGRLGVKAVSEFLAHYKGHALGNPFEEEARSVLAKLERVGGSGRVHVKAEVELVEILGGSFLMGSKYGASDEKPVRRVMVQPFWISKSEITVDQYEECVDAGRCSIKPWNMGNQCNWGQWWRGDYPMNCVDWNQAKIFAHWAGGRLPTEAEWEYAARSRGKSWVYPWGDELASCKRAVMDDGGNGCGSHDNLPVCSRTAGNTEQGLCDMAGSVWEWVEDVYHDSYSSAPTDGSARTAGGGLRVYRGGGWGSKAEHLRSAYRNWASPSNRGINIGFRLAVSSP